MIFQIISAINNFRTMQNNSMISIFFLISDTQVTLLKVLHNFKTLCMQEKIRSYLSSLHNAVRSRDPYYMETLSSQNHSTLRIFSTEVVYPEEERRGPGSSSVFI